MATTTTHARVGTTMAAAASTSDARARLGAPAARLPARAAPSIPRRPPRCRPRSRVVAARASGADDEPTPAPRPCDLYDVSDVLTPYAEAWGWQKALLEARLDALAAAEDDVELETQHLDEDNVGAEGANGDAFGHEALGARDALLLVQHPPVVTLGTGSTSDNLKFDPGAPDAPVQRTFVCLEEAPVFTGDEEDEEALEFVLEAPLRFGLSPGAPLTYRQIEVGALQKLQLPQRRDKLRGFWEEVAG